MRHFSFFAIIGIQIILNFLPAHADTALRIATWNVETIGSVGTSQYQAAQSVIRRINPDVIAIAEVASDSDVTQFKSLASSLGYLYTSIAPAGPFGSLRGAIMSKYPLIGAQAWTASQISKDYTANDLTRFILEAQIKLPNTDPPLSILTTHWKSGMADGDEFRRLIESKRVRALLLQRRLDEIPFAVMGDINENIMEAKLLSGAARTPTYFTAPPTGLPTDFKIGTDIVASMSSGGLYNNPFRDLRYVSSTTVLASLVDAKQLDGSYATRPSSQRRIDYILTSPAIAILGKQVYDCAEDSWTGGLPLYGSRIASSTCANASDHLPVVSDIVVKASSAQSITVQVSKSGSGKGEVKSFSGEINCGISCTTASTNFQKGTLVSLIATPVSGATFQGWSGACSGISVQCTFIMTANTASVSASFK